MNLTDSEKSMKRSEHFQTGSTDGFMKISTNNSQINFCLCGRVLPCQKHPMGMKEKKVVRIGRYSGFSKFRIEGGYAQ